MPIPLSQRPWLRRLFMLAAIFLFLLTILAGYVAWHNASGLSKLHQAQEELAREGRGSTIADLLKDIPPSNRERHEAFWRWQGPAQKQTLLLNDFYSAWDSDDTRKWRTGLSAEPPATLLQSIEPFAKPLTALEHLLDQGPFIAGMGGHLVDDARPNDPTWLLAVFHERDDFYGEWREDALLHVPMLQSMRVAAQVLTIKALNATAPDDREAAYRRLDVLVSAHSHPLGLLETMEYLMIAAIRDEAHLWGSLRRSVEPQRLSRWLSDQRASTYLQQVGVALRAERLLKFDCLVSLAFQGRLHQPTIRGVHGWNPHWTAWWNGPADLVVVLDAIADLERRIERGPTYPYHLKTWLDLMLPHPLAIALVPNLMESGVTATQHEFIARRARVVAALNENWKVTRTLPVDVDSVKELLGANASWFDHRPDMHDMIYERLSDSRFSISIDSNVTSGTFTPMDRYQRRADSALPHRTSRSGAPLPPPPPPRTDLPPKTPGWQLVDYEVWLPE